MVRSAGRFTGAEPSPYKRAVSVQKCVRTLDIDEVGKTTRHGTFFQMNGNFAFGDYFKQGAIEYAWELVTGSVDDGNYGFDPDQIWVTVYLDDDEAAAHWRDVGIPDHRIQRRGLKDNYWHMGVPGPGGPCSEIYVDRGPEFGPDGGPIVDEDRFLEIWNLVFQTEELSAVRAKDDFDIARQLPSKNIDTGMGLERTAYLLQGKDNMYEIDEIFGVIERAAELAGATYGADRDGDIRLRVVGDHVRSSLMLMTDGVSPGNEARGYVLRRLLRRSLRSMRLLGYEPPVIGDLLSVSRSLMAVSYPEIDEQWARVSQIAERGRVPSHLVGGHEDLRPGRGGREEECGQHFVGAAGIPTARHVRLPVRPHAGDGGRAGARGRPSGFRSLMAEQKAREGRREGEEGRRRVDRGVHAGALVGRDEIPRLHRPGSRSEGRRHRLGRPHGLARPAGRHGRGRARPDAVLRRGGRTGRRLRPVVRHWPGDGRARRASLSPGFSCTRCSSPTANWRWVTRSTPRSTLPPGWGMPGTLGDPCRPRGAASVARSDRDASRVVQQAGLSPVRLLVGDRSGSGVEGGIGGTLQLRHPG